MSTGRKILRVFIYIIVLGILAGWIFVRILSYRAVPDYNRDLSVANLEAPVHVYRDSLGNPHIYATTENDLYRVTGYLQAQDRLWQMDLLRRVTQGRLSEIFGAGFVDTDLLLRALKIPEKSAWLLDSLPAPVLGALEAYADGVNQYISANLKKLPPEFAILGYKPEFWQPVNSLNLIGYMAWDLSGGNYSAEVLLEKIRQKTGEDGTALFLPDSGRFYQDVVYPHFPEDTLLLSSLNNRLFRAMDKIKDLGVQIFSGSNNWAVAPEKSAYNLPIMANDMHLGLGMPGIWYQIHEVVEGKVNVTGVSIPGNPLIVAGHNEDIAWGMTNLYVDDIDLFREKIKEDDSTKYYYNGAWHNMEIRKEHIRIKGGESVDRMLRYTRHGPIISGFKGMKEALSMQWIGFDYSNEHQAIYLLNRAKDWNDFTSALHYFGSVSQNFVYADRMGNIGLYAAGGAPVRKGSGVMIRPGDTSTYDWKGRLSLEEFPHAYDPPDHQVSSANNRTTTPDYPEYIGTFFAQNYRIARIRQMLNSKEKLDLDDFIRMQADQHSLLAEMMVPMIRKAVERSKLPASYKETLSLFDGWTGDMSRDLAAPSVFEVTYNQFILETIRDEAGEALSREITGNSTLSRTFTDNLLHNSDNPWLDDIRTTDKKETFDDILARAYRQAVDYLTDRYGKNPGKWKWGDIHQLTLKHPLGKVSLLNRIFHLNVGPFAVGGSFHTVCPYTYPQNNPFVINHGASHRHIFIAGDWDKSLTVIPTGESGVPASDHYGDQTVLYTENRYHPDYFSKPLIVEHAKYHAVFSPGEKKTDAQ
ncbi:MAG: penicillin acylase family protein [Chlorobi bacterium]|nr:penicillin acylase family protein [Chlorobiota bacterium]